MTNRESRSGKGPQAHCPGAGSPSDEKIQVWPILVGDGEDRDPQDGAGGCGGRRSWLSLNIKTFLTMCGTGLAAAFVVSPVLLLLQGIAVESYVFLSCLMAVASLIAGLANYHIVRSGAQGIIKRVGAKAGFLAIPQAEGGRHPLNHGEIDVLETFFDSLLKRVRSDMESRLRAEQDSLLSALTSLAVALEARDPYTRSHSRNVAHFSAKLAQKMELSDAEVDEIHLAGQLHDIGKIGVRDEILLKPCALTTEEFGEIKKHPELSVDILRPFRHLDNIRAAIRHHHERMNGSGYPDGLKDDEIPLSARIMAVVDAFDAMTSDRPYRPARSKEDTVAELKQMSGPLLDPDCVQAFLEMLEEDPELCELVLVGNA